MKRRINGIIEAIKSGINSTIVARLNKKIRTTFKFSYGTMAKEYRDTIIYLIAGNRGYPRNVKKCGRK